jgi:hypothetical protein
MSARPASTYHGVISNGSDFLRNGCGVISIGCGVMNYGCNVSRKGFVVEARVLSHVRSTRLYLFLKYMSITVEFVSNTAIIRHTCRIIRMSYI